MNLEERRILDPYLATLEVELGDLSVSDRAEIILEVREHFEEARGELAVPSEAQLRNILERLGPAAAIAAEARLRFGITEQRPPLSAAARPAGHRAGALEVGALVAWVIWWPVGVLLTALSPAWTRREKATAVAVELVTAAVIVATPALFQPDVFPHGIVVLVLMLFPPTLIGLFGAGFLTWRLASPGGRTWSEPWRIAGRAGIIVISAWLLWTLLIGPLLLILTKSR